MTKSLGVTLCLLLGTINLLADTHSTPKETRARPTATATANQSSIVLKDIDAKIFISILRRADLIPAGKPVDLTGSFSCENFVRNGELNFTGGDCRIKLGDKPYVPFRHSSMAFVYRVLRGFPPVAPFTSETMRRRVFDIKITADDKHENGEVTLRLKAERNAILRCKSLNDGRNMAFSAKLSDDLKILSITDFVTFNSGFTPNPDPKIPEELKKDGNITKIEPSKDDGEKLRIEANWGTSAKLSILKRNDQDFYDGEMTIPGMQRKVNCTIEKNW